MLSGQRHGNACAARRTQPGWFNESLPGPVAGRPLALIRVDSDIYVSITDTLEALYPLLSPGGWVVFDDWKVTQAAEAIRDYRRKHGITSPMYCSSKGAPAGSLFHTIDRMVFWQKSRTTG